jgi:carboxypeptidase C (cathepsin A)
MWFWFFESRSSPKTAPLGVWLNGGPGCSSMIGLFEENGPCQFLNGSKTPSLNPYSWNEYANMLYIDQPVGVGLSYETNPPPPTVTCDKNEFCTPTGAVNGTVEVNSTITAAPYMWKFMQAFYAQFPQYENRDFGLFTESYGGHYGPEFASYFEEQNKEIEHGRVVGQKIDLVALGINNGCFERLILEKTQIDYFYENSYYPLINASTHAKYLHILETNATGLLEKCANGGSDQECMDANVNCILNVDNPLGNLIDPTVDGYDIRQHGDNTVPNGDYVAYLTDPDVLRRIGARSNYSECSGPVHDLFSATGDRRCPFASKKIRF